MKVHIYKNADGWRWRCRADNGEIVASGESYVNKSDAEHAVGLVFSAAPDDVTIEYSEDQP